MKTPKKWYDNLSDKAKIITIIMGAITALGGGGSGVYAGYAGLAKKSSVDAVIVRLDKKDLEDRIEWLDMKVYNCKQRYGRDFLGPGDPSDKDDCRRWSLELNKKLKEFEAYYKG